MGNLEESERFDTYFNATLSDTGNYISIKLPWNKSRKWLKTLEYYKFRNELMDTIQGADTQVESPEGKTEEL